MFKGAVFVKAGFGFGFASATAPQPADRASEERPVGAVGGKAAAARLLSHRHLRQTTQRALITHRRHRSGGGVGGRINQEEHLVEMTAAERGRRVSVQEMYSYIHQIILRDLTQYSI